METYQDQSQVCDEPDTRQEEQAERTRASESAEETQGVNLHRTVSGDRHKLSVRITTTCQLPWW